jgi:DNA-directed RNA polymerase beta subunit
MSQKKVDAYKEQKANRAKIIKKEKRMLRLEKLAGILVCIAAVCWVGYSVQDKVISSQEVVETETVIDTSALDEYLQSISADDAE